MDAFVKRCEQCNEPLSETSVVARKNSARIRCRQAHRKISATAENGLRYRTGRVKPKVASQDSDFLGEFEPENLSQKTKLHFERVNEVTFKLTDGERHQRTRLAWSVGWLPHHEGGGLGHQDRTRVLARAVWRRGFRPLDPSMKQRRMLSNDRGARMTITLLEIPSTTSTDCKHASLDCDGEAE